ncbi:MAG: hypothetical protein ACKOX6_04755 [Bdellovibrio sp.]
MNSKNLTALILSLGMVATLTACEEQSEKDMIAEAQFCLDKASSSASVNSCLSGIASLNSAQANALRCAGGFIGSGVASAENLSNAITSIQNGGNSVTLLTALSLDDVTLANNTANYCALSKQADLALFGAMAKSATVLANAAKDLGSCASISTCDTTQITTTINDLIADLQGGTPTQGAMDTVEAIATSVQTVYTSTCGANSSSNQDICGPINSALVDAGININTTNTQDLIDLGLALLNQWK